MEDRHSSEHQCGARIAPEERYSYYRRCQVFRKGGEQCKAPAEKGALICHAHAGQLETAVRRERERRAVLSEAVAEMRRRGNAEYEMTDLFMDFKGIQVTLAKMAEALIEGRIDCKTAGRLLVGLQMASKVLWVVHRKGREGRKEKQMSPQIFADERRLAKEKESPALLVVPNSAKRIAEKDWAAKHLAANQGEETRIALVAQVGASEPCESWPHASPEWAEPARHQTRVCTHGPPRLARAA
jgi:hypothetical protein